MILTAAQALIKLDIDSRKAPDLWSLWKKCRRAGYAINWLSQCKSPSGKGWHLVLDIRPLPKTPMEVVALTAILGGDIWREAMQMNRARAFHKVPRFMRDAWNVLYRSDSRRARHLKLGKGVTHESSHCGRGRGGVGRRDAGRSKRAGRNVQ